MPAKKSRNKRPSKYAFFLVVVLCAAAVFGLARYVRMGHSTVPLSESRVASADSGLTASQPIRTHRKYTIEQNSAHQGETVVFTPVAGEGGNPAFVRTQVEVPDDQEPAVFVVNKFLEASKVLPDGRLLSIQVDNGVASLYFNGAMNHTVGTDDEQVLLSGIYKNLSQFPEIRAVLFFADGKQIETFGDVDLTEPQEISTSDESPNRPADETQSTRKQTR